MTWAYIAGFFDGEGCLHAVGAGGASIGRFRVTISQSSDIGRAVLTKISSFLNENGIASYVLAHRHTRVDRKANCLPMWNLWITEQRSITKFIEGVFPHLHVKRQRAEDYRRLCILTPSLVGAQSKQRKIRRDVFIRLMESGKTITEIAKMYEMDYSSLWMKAKRLGFHVNSTGESNRQRAKIPVEQVIEDYRRLGSYQAVAREYGVSSFSIRSRLLNNGVIPNEPRRGRPPKNHDISSLLPGNW